MHYKNNEAPLPSPVEYDCKSFLKTNCVCTNNNEINTLFNRKINFLAHF